MTPSGDVRLSLLQTARTLMPRNPSCERESTDASRPRCMPLPAASRRVSTCEREPIDINGVGQPRSRVGGWADRSAPLFWRRIVITASSVIYTSEPLAVATCCVKPELADDQSGSVHRRRLRKAGCPLARSRRHKSKRILVHLAACMMACKFVRSAISEMSVSGSPSTTSSVG